MKKNSDNDNFVKTKMVKVQPGSKKIINQQPYCIKISSIKSVIEIKQKRKHFSCNCNHKSSGCDNFTYCESNKSEYCKDPFSCTRKCCDGPGALPSFWIISGIGLVHDIVMYPIKCTYLCSKSIECKYE